MPVRLLEQRADAAAQRTAGNIRTAEGIFDDGVIGAADFERAFARADVQAGFAVQVPSRISFPSSFSSVCAVCALIWIVLLLP